MTENHPIIEKIISASPDTYVIFFVRGCPYCENSLQLLRDKNLPYKGYDISTINGNMQKLLEVLKQNADIVSFDPSHSTKPIIFLNGKFIGGYDQLSQLLNKPKVSN